MIFYLKKFVRCLFIALLFSAPITAARADVFAYVPDITTKYLQIFNTTLNQPVEQVKLLGSPRNVQVNNSGTLVFISTVFEDGSGANQSYLNILNTASNKISVLGVSGQSVRGLTISSDDRHLFVTHKDGVTKISDPASSNTITDLDLTYRGETLVLSDDDKYLFVLGSDGFDDGVSVVDLTTFSEIANLSLGANKGAIEIVFSIDHKKLFVANSITDEVVPIKINDYDVAESLSLSREGEEDPLTFKIGARPVDLALHKNGTELLVVLSYIENDQSGPTGNGNIVILKTEDISATNTDAVNQIFFDNESSEGGASGGIIHPLAVNIDDNNNIYVLKQIWSNTTGLYVTSLKDSTDLNGIRTVKKTLPSYNLGNKVTTLANGQFLGPECDACPTGFENIFTQKEQPAAINPFLLLLISSLLLIMRRYFTRY